MKTVGLSKGISKILTKEKLRELYFDKGMSFLDISDFFGCKGSNIAYYFRKYGMKGRALNGAFLGFKPWNKGKSAASGTLTNERYLKAMKRKPCGKNHPNWKGGFWINNKGYKIIQNKRETNGEKVLEHRKVWESTNGKIAKGMVIHHINGNRLDNRIENMMLLTRAEHMNVHRKDLKRSK